MNARSRRADVTRRPRPPTRAAGRGRPRGGDPRGHARGARRGRLRPAHHGRRRPAGQGVQGDALPPLERQGQPGHRRPAPRTTSTSTPSRPVDTGSLRGDLIAVLLRRTAGSPTSRRSPPSAPILTAITRDPEFADGVPPRGRRRPSWPAPRRIFERARTRGEIGPDVDIELLAPALAGIVLHRSPRRRAPHRGAHHQRHRPDHPAGRHRGRLTDDPSHPAERSTHDRHHDVPETQAADGDSGDEVSMHLGWALVLISIAQLMVVLDGTIVNIALPYIQADLGIQPGQPALGRHRLRAGLRRPAAARRPARRPLRPAHGSS